ncbi:class I SAM-dependent methyltransferase [Saccharomonospora iraqiensis]|uniref:class I SAM-dependent methyltransferase n=1 Tax=Saccharomonospora iraqiensis TaxID=52698 RepID=UPI00022E67D0|nr:class I SAM-dependent methyltransferase [Saccharomonospora iraqiensis]
MFAANPRESIVSPSGSVFPQDTRAAFDRAAGEWLAWQRTPWARVYYALVQHTLATLLPTPGHYIDVLDVGGGNGVDSLPLLGAGHRVTVLDCSSVLLSESVAAAERDEPGRARLRIEQHDLDERRPLPLPPDSTGWDLVLCHNVLHYRDHPAELIGRLVDATRPGGTLSLIAPNPAMDVLAAAVRDRDPVQGVTMLEAPTRRSATVGQVMNRLERSDIEAAVRAAGAVVTDRFGLRTVVDLVSDDDLKHDPEWLSRTMELELALYRRDPYRDVARFWQLVCHR